MKAAPESKTVVFIILMLTPLTGASIDIYVPSLPAMSEALSASPSWVAATIPAYLLAYGLCLLLIGPLSDSLGRRRVLMTCLAGYVVATLCLIQATSIHGILLCRFLQGAFVGGPSLITKALLSDIYQGQRLKRYVNYNAIAWACGPIIAPLLGAYLQEAFCWRAPFLFLAIYASMALLSIALFLPETHRQQNTVRWRSVLGNYALIMGDRQFLMASLILTLLYSEIIGFNVQGAYVLQQLLAVKPIAFGHIALLMGGAWLLGNIGSRYLSTWLNEHRLIHASLILPLLACTLVLLRFPNGQLTLNAIIAISFVMLFFAALIFPIFYSQCIASYPTMVATASGVMTTIYIIGASLISLLLSMLTPKSELPLLFTYASLLLLTGLLYVQNSKYL